MKSVIATEEFFCWAIILFYESDQTIETALKIETHKQLLVFSSTKPVYSTKCIEEKTQIFPGNEKVISTHARKLLGTGSSGTTVPGVRIGWIVEDPIFRVSADSIFIQAADVVAYTLKEKEFPQASRKKFQADKIFDRKIKSGLTELTIVKMGL